MAAVKMRTAFDQISLSLITFLESQKGICDIEHDDKAKATPFELNRWHEANKPYRLPSDLQNFYSIQNGLLLRWRMRFNGELLPLGCLSINPIKNLEKRDISNAVFYDQECQAVDVIAAFDLDNLCLDGRIVLAFKTVEDVLGVFFQDLSCRYFFVSSSFTHYLRLLFLHIGLPRWQYAFTTSGLPQSSIQWARQLIPRRLHLDLQFRATSEFSTPVADKVREGYRPVVIDFDKIEKNARMIRAREANKRKHKKSTSDLHTLQPEEPSIQHHLTRPGSAPGRRPVPNPSSLGVFQSRPLIRPETGFRRQK